MRLLFFFAANWKRTYLIGWSCQFFMLSLFLFLCLCYVLFLSPFTFLSRQQVNMTPQITPQIAQPGHSAGQMLAQMSRQNGVPHSVAPSTTGIPLHGGPAGGGWPGAGAGTRPQFNNQVSHYIKMYYLILFSVLLLIRLHLQINQN